MCRLSATTIGMMGKTDPHSYALLVAFESFLARLAKQWDLKVISGLSVDFLVAFGAELTPRLDARVLESRSRVRLPVPLHL